MEPLTGQLQVLQRSLLGLLDESMQQDHRGADLADLFPTLYFA
jgi:hypothetical protein